MRKASEKPLLTLIATSEVNDPNLTVLAATVQDVPQHDEMLRQRSLLIEALKTVKAAGYRVTKPRKPKNFKRGKDRVGPTFVAEFADGTTTRMSVFTSLEKLDWERGERLSQAAYQSRWRTREAPPAIVSARFEQDGVVLGTRP
jgi:hypothetical protein